MSFRNHTEYTAPATPLEHVPAGFAQPLTAAQGCTFITPSLPQAVLKAKVAELRTLYEEQMVLYQHELFKRQQMIQAISIMSSNSAYSVPESQPPAPVPVAPSEPRKQEAPVSSHRSKHNFYEVRRRQKFNERLQMLKELTACEKKEQSAILESGVDTLASLLQKEQQLLQKKKVLENALSLRKSVPAPLVFPEHRLLTDCPTVLYVSRVDTSNPILLFEAASSRGLSLLGTNAVAFRGVFTRYVVPDDHQDIHNGVVACTTGKRAELKGYCRMLDVHGKQHGVYYHATFNKQSEHVYQVVCVCVEAEDKVAIEG